MNHLPDMLSAMPWVRWPPSASDMPMMVSPGLSMAKNTPWLACEPELGWTLAASAPNSSLTRSMARCLGDVDVLAAAVVALARIAFRVLVGQLAALGFHHGRRRVVFRRDQFDVILLAGVLVLDGGPQFRVDFGDGVVFGKHEILQSGMTDSTRCNWMRASRNTRGMTGSLNLLTILAAQAHGY